MQNCAIQGGFAGKRIRHTISAAIDAAHSLHAAFVANNKNIRFLIDTGATVSIIPESVAYSLNCIIRSTHVKLNAADGRKLEVRGESSLKLCSKQLRRDFQWTFVVANVSMPIIGIDFLSHFHLLVDCSFNRICDNRTQLSLACNRISTEPDNSFPILSIPTNVPECVQQLLTEYKVLLTPHQAMPNSEKSNSSTFHTIETTTQTPVFARARQLAPAKLKAAKAEFEAMLNAGIIRPSKSPWASPLHLVPKPGENQWRPCGDYRRLNSLTVPDRYPIPNVNSVTSDLFGSKVYSKIDLVKAFFQIPVHEKDIPKTSVITPFGLFEFRMMPFGLRNSAQTFQRHIDNIFRDLPYVFAYIDDLLIFSKSEDEHQKHLRVVFERLAQNKLSISIEKCVFHVPEIDFLGHRISSQGLSPLSQRVESLQEFALPQDYAGLRRFLGAMNFYRKHIPHFATICEPLYSLLGSTNQRNHTLSWNEEEIAAFEKIKQALSEATLLYHISPSQTYHLVTDASNTAVGAALHQQSDDGSKPIAFFSKRLSSTQKSYSAFDRELLAVYLSVLHFKHLIEGRNVHIFTDHKPLVSAFYSQTPAKSDRQQRQLAVISEYISSVEHISGCDNIVADAFSRNVNAIEIDFPDLSNIAEMQKIDPEIEEYRSQLKSYKLPNNTDILCDLSTKFPRPFVPESCRKKIFDHLHSLSHPGINGSIRLITARYFWPCMRRTIKLWVKECLACQSSKIQTHVRSPVEQPLFPDTDRFQTVHIDIIGPFKPSRPFSSSAFTSDHRYVVTMIDRATRWFECIPVPDITAETVASAFLSGWVARFGVPLNVVTDQGRQFESELFDRLSSIVGFHRLRTTSFHPQSNGMIERFHRTLKTALKAKKDEWLIALPLVQLALRCIPNDTSFSPITALTGTSLLTPHMYFKSELPSTREQHQFIEKLIEHMSLIDFHHLSEGIHHIKPSKKVAVKLQKDDFAWIRIDRIRKPLEAPYEGPYRIINSDAKTVKLLKNNKTITVSIDRIKPATLPISNTHSFPRNKEQVESVPTPAAASSLPSTSQRPEEGDPRPPRTAERVTRSRRVTFCL